MGRDFHFKIIDEEYRDEYLDYCDNDINIPVSRHNGHIHGGWFTYKDLLAEIQGMASRTTPYDAIKDMFEVRQSKERGEYYVLVDADVDVDINDVFEIVKDETEVYFKRIDKYDVEDSGAFIAEAIMVYAYVASQMWGGSIAWIAYD